MQIRFKELCLQHQLESQLRILIVVLQAFSLRIYLKESPDKMGKIKKGGITVGADISTEHAEMEPHG